MNVFIILSILIIVIGVHLLVSTPSVLFRLNWKEKNRKRKNPNVHVLQYFGLYNKYHLLDYQMTQVANFQLLANFNKWTDDKEITRT